MIYIKEKAVGIDIVINELQKVVSKSLGWVNYNAYHRAYKNESVNGIIAEVYKVGNQGYNGNYQEVFNDDRITASSFFLTPNTIDASDDGRVYSPNISMIFQVNLSKIEGYDNRNDEEIHRLVSLGIDKSIYGKVSSISTGIANVYSGLDSSNLKYDDMQPFHCFKVDINVNYDYSCCTDCNQVYPIEGNDIIMF